MKKVLLLLSFLVAFFVSNAQYPVIQWIGRDSALVDSRGGFKARLINYPFTDTTQANTQRISQYAGALIYTTSGGDKLWLRNSTATAWDRIGTSSGGGSGIVSLGTSAYGLTVQNDSTYKADTIQLSTRRWRQKGIDSVQGNITSGLALKLNLSDTASMLTNYVRRQELKDTAAAIRSAIGGGGSGSVTSVGSGYGLSGGPITTTGTLLVDSATLSNHYLRRKDSLTASNLLGYVTRQVLADSMAGIATSYILNEVTTGYDSLSYVEADTLKLKGLRVVAGTNATVTPTITGTTISYSISGNDTTSLSNRINLKLSIADTANMLLNYVRRQELKDTAAAIRAAMGGGSGTVTSVATNTATGITGGTITATGTLAIDTALISTRLWRQKGIDSVQANLALKVNISDTASMLTNYPRYSSLTSGQLVLANGTRNVYSSSKFNFSDATYPTMSIIGSDPLIYIGPSATLLNNPAFGHAAGAAIYGGATYKGVQLVDQISGGIQMARFYNSAGTIYNNLNGLVISNTLSSPSNYQGSYTIQRTVPYAVTGLNYHGFTDQTDFRVGTNSFNSFGSFVTIGNNRTSQGHFAAFQSVWYKDSTNRLQAVYDFVSAVSEARAGTIDTLYRFKVFEATKTGATIVKQYGIQIPELTIGNDNYGIVSMTKNGFGTYTPDSMITTTSLKATAGVRFSGLPTAKKLKQVYWDTDGTLSVGDTTAYLTESTYTPTITNTTNVAASTAYTTYYVRQGDWIYVWGTVDIDATAASTISEIGMSLPITSGIAQIYELAGTAAFEDNTAVQIKGDTTNARAMWRFTPQTNTNNKYSFHFAYKYVAP